MDKVDKIYPYKPNYEEIVNYYSDMPDIIFYKLKSWDEISSIDDLELSNRVKNELENCMQSTVGYAFYFKNKNYIFMTNDNVIYHEISHIVNRERLLDLFKINYDNLTINKINDRTEDENDFIFMDEFIAEYLSTKILKRSDKYDLLIYNLRTKRRIKFDEIDYYLGACAAIEDNIKITEKYKNLAKKILECIIFNNYKVVDIDRGKIRDIKKHLKEYLH